MVHGLGDSFKKKMYHFYGEKYVFIMQHEGYWGYRMEVIRIGFPFEITDHILADITLISII